MIEFRTLGTLDIRDPATGRAFRPLLAQPKRVALLAYLGLARPRGFHHRDTLLGMFWPEVSQERARHALNQALHFLRRGLGKDVVVTRGAEEIGIDPQKLWCDVAAFESALDAGEQTEALELYGGDLLTGFYLSDCPAFEQWLGRERARLRERAVVAAKSAAEGAEARGNPVEATHWLRQAIAWTPYDEAVLHSLLTLLRRLGDRAGAIREYEAFAERLRQDYEAEPAPETRELIEAVRARAEPDASVVQGPAAASRAIDASFTRRAPDRLAARRPSWLSRHRGLVGGLALAAVFAVVAAIVANRRGGAATLDRARVLVDVFENETGDPALDPLGRMAADWIAQELAQTGLVRVVPSSMVRQEAPDLEEGAADRRSLARALAEATRAGTVVFGSYHGHGDSIAFQAQITDVATGEILRAVDGVDGSVEAAVEAVELLRQRITGALATVLDSRLSSWASAASQPPSFEAYKLYTAGLEAFLRSPTSTARRRSYREAADYFHRAAALDSSFTLPLLWATYAHANAGDWGKGDSVARLLDRRRARLAPWESALLDARLARFRGDLLGMYHGYERMVEISPSSEWLYKLGAVAHDLNRQREAVEILDRLDPERGWLKDWRGYWIVLVRARHLLGEHELELRDSDRYRAQFPEAADELFFEVPALGALGRTEEVLARVKRSLYAPALMWDLALELRAHGHETAGREAMGRALAILDEQPDYSYGEWLRLDALENAGRLEEATARLKQMAADTSPNSWPTFLIRGWQGVLAAKRGDREEAERVSNWLRELEQPYLFGENTLWRARIAANLGKRDQAVRFLRQAAQEGYKGYMYIHTDPHLHPLRDYPPFQEFLRPKG